MGTACAILVIVVAVRLVVAAQTGRIHDKTLERLANIGGIAAFVGVVGTFCICSIRKT